MLRGICFLSCQVMDAGMWMIYLLSPGRLDLGTLTALKQGSER